MKDGFTGTFDLKFIVRKSKSESFLNWNLAGYNCIILRAEGSYPAYSGRVRVIWELQLHPFIQQNLVFCLCLDNLAIMFVMKVIYVKLVKNILKDWVNSRWRREWHFKVIIIVPHYTITYVKNFNCFRNILIDIIPINTFIN